MSNRGTHSGNVFFGQNLNVGHLTLSINEKALTFFSRRGPVAFGITFCTENLPATTQDIESNLRKVCLFGIYIAGILKLILNKDLIEHVQSSHMGFARRWKA